MFFGAMPGSVVKNPIDTNIIKKIFFLLLLMKIFPIRRNLVKYLMPPSGRKMSCISS